MNERVTLTDVVLALVVLVLYAPLYAWRVLRRLLRVG